MAFEANAPSGGQPGSGANNSTAPSTTNGGQAAAGQDYEKAYRELESKFGTQGQELGEHRAFVKNLTPLLEKLDSQPEIVQAIMAGKLDGALATAALEGKVNIEAAAIVNQAHEDVKRDLGKDYMNTTPEAIQAMIAEKVAEEGQKITTQFSEKEDLRDFENRTAAFIASKPDFATYSEEINNWLGEHKDIDDVSIAYSAVKGAALEAMLASGNQEQIAEAAKLIAMNASGAASQGGSAPRMGREQLLDSLIAPHSNPNNF